MRRTIHHSSKRLTDTADLSINPSQYRSREDFLDGPLLTSEVIAKSRRHPRKRMRKHRVKATAFRSRLIFYQIQLAHCGTVSIGDTAVLLKKQSRFNIDIHKLTTTPWGIQGICVSEGSVN